MAAAAFLEPGLSGENGTASSWACLFFFYTFWSSFIMFWLSNLRSISPLLGKSASGAVSLAKRLPEGIV